jgi:cyclic pyranopterin phosphate synthase
MLTDEYGRVVTNLRIAITNRCNLNCFYCHKEGEKAPKNEVPAERILEIVNAFYELGVRKVKLTGGEPLLRKDIFDIISEMPDFKEVSLTTNGILLEKVAHELKECGLDRVNVSLDTLKPEKYRFITGGGDVKKVIAGIEAACEANLTPVKVNMVLMKGINESEVDELLDFTRKFNYDDVRAILQIIELLKTPEMEKYYYDISGLEEKYAQMSKEIRIRAMHRRKQYWIEDVTRGITSVIEFVKPLDNSEFCRNCNRMRVTSDGKLKMCLLRDETIDVSDLHGEELMKAIKYAVSLRKPYFSHRNL